MVEVKGTPFQTDNLTAAQAVKSSQKNYQFDLMPLATKISSEGVNLDKQAFNAS